MPQPSASSDPAHIIARIEYNFLRHQILTSQVAGVSSRAAAREWALGFRDRWCKLLDHGNVVGTDPMSDPEIQHFLGNLQSRLVCFITSEWVDLVPAIVGSLIPAARALPPGNSLTEGYEAASTSSPTLSAIPATATISPVPADSHVPHSPLTGFSLSQPAPPPSRGLPSGSAHPPLTILSQDVGRPQSLLPTQILIRPTESGSPMGPTSAVDIYSATTSMRPAKRAKITTRSSAPKAVDLMPKNKLPLDYIRCERCQRLKKGCAPLRDATPPYDTCGRCKLAGVPCVPISRSVPVQLPVPSSPAPDTAGTTPISLHDEPIGGASSSRAPSPSVVAHSSRESSPAEYPPDQEFILEDGYPLQPQHIPLSGTDSTPLADVLALNSEINASTISALQGLANIRAAEAEATAAHWRYVAARAALRAAQANVEVFRSRRRSAWEHLVTLLGENAFCSFGSESTLTPRPSGSGQREKDDMGDARAVEDMLDWE